MSDIVLAAQRHLAASSRHVLLVSGSRSFERKPQTPAERDQLEEAMVWGMGILERVIVDLPPGAIVFQGGAEGPDNWAIQLARKHEVRCVTYRPSGWRYDTHAKSRRWSMTGVHPKVRDEAMVRGVSRALGQGWVTGVVGVVDAASPTGGTDYTLRLCREAGIRGTRYLWSKGVPDAGLIVSVGDF